MIPFDRTKAKTLGLTKLSTWTLAKQIETFPVGKTQHSRDCGYNETYYLRFISAKSLELNVLPSLKLLKAMGYSIHIHILPYESFLPYIKMPYDSSSFLTADCGFSRVVKKRSLTAKDVVTISGAPEILVNRWMAGNPPSLFLQHLTSLQRCGIYVNIRFPTFK